MRNGKKHVASFNKRSLLMKCFYIETLFLIDTGGGETTIDCVRSKGISTINLTVTGQPPELQSPPTHTDVCVKH